MDRGASVEVHNTSFLNNTVRCTANKPAVLPARLLVYACPAVVESNKLGAVAQVAVSFSMCRCCSILAATWRG